MPPRQIEFAPDIWKHRYTVNPFLPHHDTSPWGGIGYENLPGPQTINPQDAIKADLYQRHLAEQEAFREKTELMDALWQQVQGRSALDESLPVGMPGQEDPAFYEIINQMLEAAQGMPQVYSDIGTDIYERGPEIQQAAMEMLKRMYPVSADIGQMAWDYMPPVHYWRALTEVGFPTARGTASVVGDVIDEQEPTEIPGRAIEAALDPDAPELGTKLGYEGLPEFGLNALGDPATLFGTGGLTKGASKAGLLLAMALLGGPAKSMLTKKAPIKMAQRGAGKVIGKIGGMTSEQSSELHQLRKAIEPALKEDYDLSKRYGQAFRQSPEAELRFLQKYQGAQPAPDIFELGIKKASTDIPFAEAPIQGASREYRELVRGNLPKAESSPHIEGVLREIVEQEKGEEVLPIMKMAKWLAEKTGSIPDVGKSETFRRLFDYDAPIALKKIRDSALKGSEEREVARIAMRDILPFRQELASLPKLAALLGLIGYTGYRAGTKDRPRPATKPKQPTLPGVEQKRRESQELDWLIQAFPEMSFYEPEQRSYTQEELLEDLLRNPHRQYEPDVPR